MAGVLAKLRTLTLSNVHALLDATIDLNSLEAVKQHVRDLQDERDKMVSAAGEAEGHVRSTSTEIAVLETKIKDTGANIDLILGDGDASNDHLAERLDLRLQEIEAELEAKREELADLTKIAGELNNVAEQLAAKHRRMMEQLRKLQTLDRTAAIKERATAALRAAGTGGVDRADVDNVERRIRERSDRAGAQFDRAMDDTREEADVDVAAIKAKQRIAERKAKLAEQTAAPAAETNTPTT